MKNLNKTATVALIALMSAAPIAAFADAPQTGSPQQAVDNDSDEKVAKKPVSGESMHDTAKADQGENAYDDADVVENVDGSMVEDDAKADG